MAQRGRKPKPTALKVLEGNPGGRPLNLNEPKPVKKAPRCPSWLEDEAKKEWKRMGKVLEQLGLLLLDIARHMPDGKKQRNSLHSMGRW